MPYYICKHKYVFSSCILTSFASSNGWQRKRPFAGAANVWRGRSQPFKKNIGVPEEKKDTEVCIDIQFIYIYICFNV